MVATAANSNMGVKALVQRYIEAEGQKDWEAVASLLSEDLKFRLGDKEASKAQYLAVLKRLGLVWSGNRIKRIFVERNEAVALYDFISDTPSGAVPCVEWIRVRGERICEIDLLFEREHWGIVEEEMKRRAEAAATQGG